IGMGDLNFKNEEGTFLLSHRRAMSDHMPVSHFHSTYEIYYLMSGQREMSIRDRTITLEEGVVIIIAPTILQRTANAERPQHERFIINIHERLFSSDGSHKEGLQPLLDRDYMIVNASLRNRFSIDSIARAIIQEMQEREGGFELFARTL